MPPFPLRCIPTEISDGAELDLLDATIGLAAAGPKPALVLLPRAAADGGFLRGWFAAGAAAESFSIERRGSLVSVACRRVGRAAGRRTASSSSRSLIAALDIAQLRAEAPLVTLVRAAEMIAAAEGPREPPRDHGLQRRQAGADDAGVDFEAGPDGRERVVVGDVGCLQEYEQGLQAQDGDDAGEAAEGEDDHQGDALAFGQLQLVEEGEGEGGDEDVC